MYLGFKDRTLLHLSSQLGHKRSLEPLSDNS